MYSKFLLSTLASIWIPIASIQAQDPQNPSNLLPNKDQLQKSSDILVGVLEESLELKNKSRVFGLSYGGVESTYLFGQGLLLKINTPLATEFSRLGLTGLSGTLQELANRSVPRPPMPPLPEIMALNVDSDAFSNMYTGLIEKWTELELSASVSEASSRAANAARSLRNLGELDQQTYETFQFEMEQMRAELESQLEQFRYLQEQWKADAQDQSDSGSDELETALADKLNALLEEVAPLRDKALQQAEELHIRFTQGQRAKRHGME